MSEQHTRGPWETEQTAIVYRGGLSKPREWTYVKHNFPDAPYEGELNDEWGVYPPLGESGPVALVAGEANARLIVTACNSFPQLLDACENTADKLANWAARLANVHVLIARELQTDEQKLRRTVRAARGEGEG